MRLEYRMMEFYDVINKRRSIRQFEDRAIPRELLVRILDAGLKAPSSNHQRKWELLTLTDKALMHKIAQIVKPYPLPHHAAENASAGNVSDCISPSAEYG